MSSKLVHADEVTRGRYYVRLYTHTVTLLADT